MSAKVYLEEIGKLIEKVKATQMENIEAAGLAFAKSIAAGGAVHIFGSGHSVLPVQDMFPRYGSFIGFNPIFDPRLMWSNVTGPGGARELLWLERREGYAANILASYKLDPVDSMLVFSHGGMNAAPIEVGLLAKEQGLTVVAITCAENVKVNKSGHSSGESLQSLADIVIDNSAPPEDALVSIDGVKGNVAASSTVTATTIAIALVAETAAQLAAMGKAPDKVFFSPNVPGIPADNTSRVYEDFQKFKANLMNRFNQ